MVYQIVCRIGGIGETVLKMNNMDENKGYVPNFSQNAKDTANLSIGQGSLLATPLQAADFICTISNEGVKKQLMLIKGYANEKGEPDFIRPSELERVVSKETAVFIIDSMKETVLAGTGTNAKSEYFSSAGKTASAESGWKKGEKTMTHAWFAGFFPAEAPKYGAVVFLENGKSGGDTAAPIFKKISEEIMKLR